MAVQQTQQQPTKKQETQVKEEQATVIEQQIVEKQQPAVKEQPQVVKTKAEVYLTSFIDAISEDKVVSKKEGAARLKGLYELLMEILSMENSSFRKEWFAVLKMFNKHKDKTFKDNVLFRHLEEWSGSKKDFNLYRSIIYVCLDSCSSKKLSPSVSLDTVVAQLSSEKQKTNLVGFYQ